MSPQVQEQIIPSPIGHRADCCDACGIADECTKITSRCWPNGGQAENCANCKRCWDFQNQFIKRPIVITEVQ